MGKNQTTAGARQRARRQAKLKKNAPRLEKNKKYTSAAKSTAQKKSVAKQKQNNKKNKTGIITVSGRSTKPKKRTRK